MRFVLLCIMAVLGLVVFWSLDFQSVEHRSNIDIARELYERVNNTRPSVVSAKVHEEIIRERLECYARNNDYARRIRECNNLYAKSIVKQARTVLTSRPDMGLFVKNINLCPVVHNMCIGQTENDVEKCIVFERQCIDYTLDTFWRGASRYTQQQYRTE